MLVNPCSFASLSAASLPPRISTAQFLVYSEYPSTGRAEKHQHKVITVNNARQLRETAVSDSLILRSDYLALRACLAYDYSSEFCSFVLYCVRAARQRKRV